MYRVTLMIIISFTFMVYVSNGIYIKSVAENESTKSKDEWSVFKQKLGLTNQKVELLKSQKDQQGTIDLLNRFIKENPKYNTATIDDQSEEPSNHFMQVYHNLLKQIKLSKSTLKTSVNFELADKSQKNFKRSRRKIAVRMVSDMPSDKIDDLLKMFIKKHDINNDDYDDVDVPEDKADKESIAELPSDMDSDYMYENLYEDEEDMTVSAKSHHNSQYPSIQDLIMQASRNQWHHEIEETKLRNRYTEHFI